MTDDLIDLLEQQIPDHDGDTCIAITTEERDKILVALRIMKVIQPFIDFTRTPTFNILSDEFELTAGSPMAHRQLTAGDFRRLLEAIGEKPYRR